MGLFSGGLIFEGAYYRKFTVYEKTLMRFLIKMYTFRCFKGAMSRYYYLFKKLKGVFASTKFQNGLVLLQLKTILRH